MLYFLGCNWQKLPKLIKYFKEPSVGARKAKISEDYVAICKPGQNFISTIEKCQSSPHGYALRRGVLWRTTFAIECERRIPAPEFSKFVRLQTQTPPGWPPDPEDTKSLPLATSLAGFGFGFYTARDPLVAPAPPGPIRRARTE